MAVRSKRPCDLSYDRSPDGGETRSDARSAAAAGAAAALSFSPSCNRGGACQVSVFRFRDINIDRVAPAARLYESPFTDFTPHGPEALFSSPQVKELLDALESVRRSAIAA